MNVLAQLVASFGLGTVAVAQSAPPHRLVQVRVDTPQSMSTLLALDLDLAACGHIAATRDRVDVIATDRDLNAMRRNGLSFEIVIPDLHAEHAQRMSGFAAPETLTPPMGQGAMGGHYTLAQIEAILDRMHTDHPTLCSAKVSIGLSIEGRELWMVKISDNVNQSEPEPRALFTGLHHAREPLSMETAILFMDELLDGYGSDPDATFLIDNRELYFVPCVNPDGYEYNRQTNPNGGGLWRKNRRLNTDGSIGVDLNRNYTIGWNAPNGGNSSNPSSSTYRGTAPLSEPETTALDAFVAATGFVQVFNCHTYTDILLHPSAYQFAPPANVAEYRALAEEMTCCNGIGYGTIFSDLYPIAGGAADHYHTVHGAYAWLPELGKLSEGGFWPDPTNTVAIARRHQPMLRAVAFTAGPYPKLANVVISEAPGGNGNGIIEPGESGEVRFDLANPSPDVSTAVGVTLTTPTPGISITGGQFQVANLGAFGSTSNASAPLTFDVPASFTAFSFELSITMNGVGRTVSENRVVPAVPLRLALDDDMEADRGFALDPASTATTGDWERTLPQQTISGATVFQPGTQATPGGQRCWFTDGRAGTSVGSFDVDGGYTDLVTPTLDLAHFDAIQFEVSRWYAESASNDPFEIAISLDGGLSWSTLLRDSSSTGAWTMFRSPTVFNPTGETVIRFRAQDLEASLVEAGIDDLRIFGAAQDGALSLLSSGRVGTTARLGILGRAADLSWILVSANLAATPLNVPGIAGQLLLDPIGSVPLPGGALGASGYAAQDLDIPNDTALIGQTFRFQSVLRSSSGAWTFGNLQSLELN